ncbi:MAG TPA: hypothetical protein VIL30_04560 [Ramlibacter sp.]|jgi:hypothetical protein
MNTHRSDPIYFLAPEELPPGFQYPESYRALAATNAYCIGPVNEDWCFIDRQEMGNFRDYARKLSPGRPLIPFMRRNGEDGVACFDGSCTNGNPTVYQFNYCVEVGCGGGVLSFDQWLALIPPEEEGDEA